MKVLPFVYCDRFDDADIARHDCSDRIWVSRQHFEDLNATTEAGVAMIVRLTNSVTQSVPALVYAAHNDAEDIVYAPAWIVAELAFDTSDVSMTRWSPSLGTRITIAPHTSDHLHGPEDPQTLLRNAFEQYTCLVPGLDYCLWLGDHAFTVSLTNVEPAGESAVCIRGNELELELLAPLDRPVTPPAPAPVPAPVPVPAPWTPPMTPAELREAMAAAARTRMALRKPDNI